MILLDVNVLVYAFREGADRHADYARWLGEAVNDTEPLLLADPALTGFVRIVTDPRISKPVSSTASAFGFVRALQAAPPARSVSSTPRSWAIFDELLQSDRRLRGRAVSDVYLASLASAHGARLATRDRGFARFGKQLRWFDPADAG